MKRMDSLAFADERELELAMSEPSQRMVDAVSALGGDIAILGIGGKIGVTLGMAAARAVQAAGGGRRVYGVSRFSDRAARERLEAAGVDCVPCDLLDRGAVASLPEAAALVFMAGRKFGTSGSEEATWAMNTVVPANAAERYPGVPTVVYSTGCVYALESPYSGGSSELDPPRPVGEYAQSALGRERVYEHYSLRDGTPVCLFRLNYAIDPRYGVLHDIASKVRAGEPVDLSAAAFNCIWQGDVIERTFLAFSAATSPASALNVTGPETASTRRIAEAFGRRFGKSPEFRGDGLSGVSYLADATKSFGLFGYPRVSLAQMVDAQAEWLLSGGSSLGKPTHFEATDGTY